MNRIAQTAIIHSGVHLGDGIVIEDFCIIGAPYPGQAKDEETVIGDNAVIRSHTVIYAGNRIGSGFQTGNKANIRERNNIGDRVSVGTMSVIEHRSIIEDEVRIHSQAFIPEFTILKSGSWIGPNVVLTNARYPRSRAVKENLKGVIVFELAKIGANSTVLPGVRIGRNALVGAGSVVTHDVRENTIVAGNPAVLIREIDY